MSAPTVDQVISHCGINAVEEARECMRAIDPYEDLTPLEQLALLALLRPIRDRVQGKPAAVLNLVRP